jgi:hypothetical protein
MKRVTIAFVVMMAVLSHALCSFGSMEDLVNMVENKSFWAVYNWNDYEESELYKSISWKRMPPNVTNIKSSYDLSTPIFEISNMGPTLIHMSVMLPDKNVLWITLFGTLSQDDQFYKRFVSWCEEKFGTNHVEGKRDWVAGKGRHEIFTTTWELENTLVQVILDKDSSNGDNQPKCFTQLNFLPNKRRILYRNDNGDFAR